MSVAWGLVGGALEVIVAQAAAAAAGDDELLAFFGHFAQHLACLCVAADAAQRHLEDLVAAGAAGAEVLAAMLAVFSEDMFGVLEVQECPALGGAAQDDVATASAVAAVGSCLGVVLHPQQVCRAGAALAAAHQDFDVIYEVARH